MRSGERVWAGEEFIVPPVPADLVSGKGWFVLAV